MAQHHYEPVLALTVISGIFLVIGAVCAVGIGIDILWRRGWQSMMAIMIPVYIINATYLGPLAVYVYYRFGRPPASAPSKEAPPTKEKTLEEMESQNTSAAPASKPSSSEAQSPIGRGCHSVADQVNDGEGHLSGHASPEDVSNNGAKAHAAIEHHACQHSSSRPFWATVTAGVFHCGAGCVLGDIVGEWIVYGSNATITGRMVWVELLLDYLFALIFGIVFQYFSIAPMSGQWGPFTVVRAAKADVLSLTSFQVGLFAWMIAYQVGMFDYELDMATWTYWWLMQVGMALGVVTAWPVNWWLLKKGIKEACC